MFEADSADGDRPAGPDFRRRTRRGRLEVEVWIAHGRAVLRAVGDLDVQSAPALAEALAEALPHAVDPGVLLLVDHLAFTDSSGLGVLVAAFKRADSAGGAVALAGASEFLARTLRVTGLAPLLPIFPDEIEAAAWLDRKTRARAGNRPGRARFPGITPA